MKAILDMELIKMNPTELRAIIASIYELTDMLLAKLDQSTPSPARPALPWLDATDPNNDPDDGDIAWMAVKGCKGWVVVLSFWNEGRSEWLLGEDGRHMFGFVNHRDVECYHCPASSFPTTDDAVASLAVRDGVLDLKEPAPLNRDDITDKAIALADMLLAKLDQSTPSPTRPALPWLDATDPNNDPSDGDEAWLAIKGRKGWTVVLSFWDKERSERFLTENGRYVLGHINHRDLDCYHCPASSFPTVDDAVASLPK